MHNPRRISILCLFLSLAAAVSAQSEDKERLVLLDGHLRAISTEARTGRLVGGFVLLGSGLALGGLMVASGRMLDSSDYLGLDLDQYYTTAGIAFGLAFAVPGAVLLALPSEAETLPRRFMAMPEGEEEERALKISAGEAVLESLAEKARFRRMAAGASSLVFGLYFFAAGGAFDRFLPGLGARLAPSLGYTGSFDYEYGYDPRSAYLYEGFAFASSGALAFLLESRAERERKAYFRRFPARRAEGGTEGRAALAPWLSFGPTGPSLGLGLAL